MKFKFVLLLLLFGSALMLPAVPLKPVVVAHRGQPTMTLGDANAPLDIKQSISPGAIIETDKDSKVAVAIAPGQMVVLGNKTKLKVISIHDAEASKGAVIELEVGIASFYIDPKYGHSGPVFELIAGKETIKAKGTTWTTGKSGEGSSGTVSTTVTSSAVSVTPSGATASFTASAGSVVTSTYSPSGAWTGSVVVNLVTGTVTTISADGGSTTGSASAAQLASAAAGFQAAVNDAAAGGVSSSEGAALTALISNINTTLTNAGAGVTITAADGSSSGSLIVDSGSNTRDTITASPETN